MEVEVKEHVALLHEKKGLLITTSGVSRKRSIDKNVSEKYDFFRQNLGNHQQVSVSFLSMYKVFFISVMVCFAFGFFWVFLGGGAIE